MNTKVLRTKFALTTTAMWVGLSGVLLCSVALAQDVAVAQNEFEECGWMQRSERASDEPLTEQELIALREQEIEQLVNQSEHCLAQSSGGNGDGGGGADSQGGGGGSDQDGADNAGSGKGAAGEDAGAPPNPSPSQSTSTQSASSNALADGETSIASSVPKGTYRSLPKATANQSDNADTAHANSAQEDPTVTGTGIGAPRAEYETADNKERLRQQLKAKIAATDDPELKKKLQERLDALK